MTLKQRILTSIIVAVASAALSYVLLGQRGYLASDFEYPLRAARVLLVGENPYEAIRPQGPYPYEKPFYYTLPAGIIALPFAYLDSYVAGACFFGISSGLLAFSLTKEKPWRLLMLLSAPFFVAAQVAQWSPLLIAAALLPPLRFLLACKPNLGLALLAYLPSRRELVRGVLTILVFVVLTVALRPSWIAYWLVVTLSSRGDYVAPLLVFPGFLLLLSVLRVRLQEGRLLLVMSLLPQFLFSTISYPSG